MLPLSHSSQCYRCLLQVPVDNIDVMVTSFKTMVFYCRIPFLSESSSEDDSCPCCLLHSLSFSSRTRFRSSSSGLVNCFRPPLWFFCLPPETNGMLQQPCPHRREAIRGYIDGSNPVNRINDSLVIPQ